ncbi:MAG: zf-HC2 domain-containing protein [Fimbriimonadia bacterium]
MIFIRRGCARFRADISLLHDGYLSESRRKRLEKHLAMCEPCRVQRDLIHRLSQELSASADVVPSPDFDDHVVSALRLAGLQRPSWTHWRQFSVAATAAAVLMTAVLQYAALGESPNRPSASPDASANVRPDDLLEQYKLDRNSPLWYHRDLPVEENKEKHEPTRATG